MKFRKLRVTNYSTTVEDLAKRLEESIIANGVVDITRMSCDDASKLIDMVKTPIKFVSSDSNQVTEIENKTIFKINTLINKNNINDILKFIRNDVVIDFNSLDVQQIRTISRVRDLNIERYYSQNPLMNIFLNIGDYIYLDDKDENFILKCILMDKNQMVGSVKCKNCEAYGICDITPKDFHISPTDTSISVSFQNDERCYELQNLVNFGENKVLSSNQLKVIVQSLDSTLTDFKNALGSNNVFLLELSNVLEQICNGGSNE